jgi:hypothetical protein
MLGGMFDPIHTTGPAPSSAETFFLRGAPAAYVRQLRQGVALVLNGILLMVALMAILMFVVITMSFQSGGQPPSPMITGAAQLVMLIPTAMMVLGYWKYSERDPVYMGEDEPKTSREILRASTVASAIMTVVNGAFAFIGGNPNFVGAMQSGGLGIWVLVSIALSALGVIIWIAQFLSAMKYTSWIGRRLADPGIEQRADQFMWLLPLIYVLGMFCFGLGPLIALVLYWNLLNRVRKEIRAVEAGQPA